MAEAQEGGNKSRRLRKIPASAGLWGKEESGRVTLEEGGLLLSLGDRTSYATP